MISSLNGIGHFVKLVKELNLENFVRFLGYTPNPAIYYKNASIYFRH